MPKPSLHNPTCRELSREVKNNLQDCSAHQTGNSIFGPKLFLFSLQSVQKHQLSLHLCLILYYLDWFLESAQVQINIPDHQTEMPFFPPY